MNSENDDELDMYTGLEFEYDLSMIYIDGK